MTMLCILLFVGFLLMLYAPLPWLYGRVVRIRQKAQSVSRRQLFLTFDDGPGSRLTTRILAILKEHDVRATFFVLGRNIMGREKILELIAQEGHLLASHSYNHLHAWKVLPWRSVADVRRGFEAMDRTLLGKARAGAFRPPNGKLNLFTVLYLLLQSVRLVYWTVDSGDTWPLSKRNVAYAAERIKSDGGGIVLFHDFDRTTDRTDEYVLGSLKEVLKTGKDMRLSFACINQLWQNSE